MWEGRVVGYYCFFLSVVDWDDGLFLFIGGMLVFVLIVLFGWFVVDQEFVGWGFGVFLLQYVIVCVFEVVDVIGVWVIFVYVINDDVVVFYVCFGFMVFLDVCCMLYLLMKDVCVMLIWQVILFLVDVVEYCFGGFGVGVQCVGESCDGGELQ